MCIIELLNFQISFLTPTNIAVCSEGGRVVGLDINEGAGDEFGANNTQIFHEYGGINCYGMVTVSKRNRN